MKNKLLLAVLPLLALTSCGSNASAFVPYVSIENNVHVYNVKRTEHVTYLMMSRYGYLDDGQGGKTYGTTVEAKFYEYCIALKDEAGSKLPTPKSDVNGATFRGWVQYNDKVYPDYVEEVPAKNGETLYAIFDGVSSGGGVTPTPTPTPTPGETTTWTVKDMPTWVTNDGCVIFAWAWQNGVDGKWYALSYTSDTSATFVAPSDLAGMLLARCAADTTLPDWNNHESGPGRVYNQTTDVVVTSGTTEYSFPNEMWIEYK